VKALLDFLEPHGLVLMGLVALAGWLWRSRSTLKAAFASALALLAALVLCTPFSSWLIATLERPWPPLKFAEVEPFDVVICLGGGMEPSRVEPAGLKLKGGADRMICTIELLRQGKARALVLGGGGYRFHDGQGSEADAVKAWITAWQLTTVPVHSLGICADTHDEAVKMAGLAAEQSWKRIALVTSASHMTRAKATFEKAGVPVTAVPCNYGSQQMRQELPYWIKTPDVNGYAYFEAWMHEVIGMWVYRWRGWL
jgi:uncharacterized SAM-binding protein YcdF (DUF218 family)